MFGKDTKKKELINNLDQVITICVETEKFYLLYLGRSSMQFIRGQLYLTVAKSCRSENDNVGHLKTQSETECEEDILLNRSQNGMDNLFSGASDQREDELYLSRSLSNREHLC